MDREEAIKILKDTLYDEKTPTDYLEAVKMGREALESQTSVIEELEDIKADVINIADGRQSIKVKSVRNIIDRRVAELKGENKKECSTCKSDNSHENCLGCIEYGHWELKGENKCQNQTN